MNTTLDYVLAASSTPIRLALAAQMQAALLANPTLRYTDSPRAAARIALDHADALLQDYACQPRPVDTPTLNDEPDSGINLADPLG
jgi:hypothetical protein